MTNLPKQNAFTSSQLQPFVGDRSMYLGTVGVANLSSSNLLSAVDSAKYSQSVSMSTSPKEKSFENSVSVVFEGL